MNKTNPQIEIGSTLYLEPTGSFQPYGRTDPVLVEATVYKVARKYLYVKINGTRRDARFDKGTLAFSPVEKDLNGTYKVFLSKEAFEEHMLRRKQLGQIREVFATWGSYNDLPSEIIAEIYSILERSNVLPAKECTMAEKKDRK